MTAEAKKSGSFLSMFIPGLIVGLLVGAAAGAFLPPILERQGIGLSDAPVSGPVQSKAPRERDAQPAATPPADAPSATDPTKMDPAADPKPDPAPADPATTPK